MLTNFIILCLMGLQVFGIRIPSNYFKLISNYKDISVNTKKNNARTFTIY